MGTEERKVREIRDEKRNNVYGTAVRRAVAGIVLFAAAFLLLFAASVIRRAFAQWYTLHVYSFFVATLGRFFGIFAFSASEFMLYVLIAFLVWQISKDCVQMPAGKECERAPGSLFLRDLSGGRDPILSLCRFLRRELSQELLRAGDGAYVGGGHGGGTGGSL